ncbi:hypothetical protein D3C87_1838190 [compost metagenome]
MQHRVGVPGAWFSVGGHRLVLFCTLQPAHLPRAFDELREEVARDIRSLPKKQVEFLLDLWNAADELCRFYEVLHRAQHHSLPQLRTCLMAYMFC